MLRPLLLILLALFSMNFAHAQIADTPFKVKVESFELCPVDAYYMMVKLKVQNTSADTCYIENSFKRRPFLNLVSKMEDVDDPAALDEIIIDSLDKPLPPWGMGFVDKMSSPEERLRFALCYDSFCNANKLLRRSRGTIVMMPHETILIHMGMELSGHYWKDFQPIIQASKEKVRFRLGVKLRYYISEGDDLHENMFISPTSADIKNVFLGYSQERKNRQTH